VLQQDLLEMSAEDMASDSRKADNQKIREHALWDAERGASKKATTDQFQCGKCRQRKCTYYVRSSFLCSVLYYYICSLVLQVCAVHCKSDVFETPLLPAPCRGCGFCVETGAGKRIHTPPCCRIVMTQESFTLAQPVAEKLRSVPRSKCKRDRLMR